MISAIASMLALGRVGRWISSPSGSALILGVAAICGVFLIGYWLRWDARADATRAVIDRVTTTHKIEANRRIAAAEIRNANLERDVEIARRQAALEQQARETLEAQVADTLASLQEAERKLASTPEVKNCKPCGLNDRLINLMNKVPSQ